MIIDIPLWVGKNPPLDIIIEREIICCGTVWQVHRIVENNVGVTNELISEVKQQAGAELGQAQPRLGLKAS